MPARKLHVPLASCCQSLALKLFRVISLIENLQDDIKKTLDELNDLYLSTRYSGDFDKLVKVLHKEKVEELFSKSKEVFKWLQKKIS